MTPWKRSLRCSHHAGAVAVVTVRDFGARLMTFTLTAWTVVLYVHGDLLVHAFGCLCESQLHDVLHPNNTENFTFD